VVVKNNDKPNTKANGKTKPERGKIHLQLAKLPEPNKLKNWYVNYLLSDFTFASISVAILMTIKVAMNLEWDRFWNYMLLWYVVYIATMVARVVKTFCDKHAKPVKPVV